MRELLNFFSPSVQWESAAQWAFFKVIFDFIDDEIKAFQVNVLDSMLIWASGIALTLVTLWLLWQGYRVMQGQTRNAMELVVDGARAAFIATMAMTFTLGHSNLYDYLANKLPAEISEIMTGERKSAGDQIDDSMNQMEAVMAAINALDVGEGSPNLKADKDRAMWMAGIGVAGPSMVGGALQVMYKVALALFIGLAPLFILCLLFKQTASLFQKWLLYGIGTMFAQAVMAFMAVMVAKIVVAVGAAFAAQYLIAAATPNVNPMSVSGMAMLQGGIGLLLTLTLVTIPPMAASFFQGTLGSYMAYSVFGGNAGAQAGQRPGEQGYRGPTSVQQQASDREQQPSSGSHGARFTATSSRGQ